MARCRVSPYQKHLRIEARNLLIAAGSREPSEKSRLKERARLEILALAWAEHVDANPDDPNAADALRQHLKRARIADAAWRQPGAAK